MTEFDDDLLIRGAFRELDATDVRVAGVAAVHSSVRRTRRNTLAMLGGLSALVIATSVIAFAAIDRAQPPSPPLSSPSLSNPSPTASPDPAFRTAHLVMVDPGVAVHVYSYSRGKATLLATLPDPDQEVASSITVSPDGTRLAWVADGSLRVSNMDGSQPSPLLKNVDFTGKSAPVWAPDSASLFTNLGRVAVTGGGTAAFGPYHYLTWAPDGSHYAYSVGNKVIVADSSGNIVREHTFLCGNCETPARSALALSANGRYLALGTWPTDTSRAAFWQELYDVNAGLTLQVTVPPVASGRFLDETTFVVVRELSIEVWTTGGQVLSVQPLPAELNGAVLLRVS